MRILITACLTIPILILLTVMRGTCLKKTPKGMCCMKVEIVYVSKNSSSTLVTASTTVTFRLLVVSLASSFSLTQPSTFFLHVQLLRRQHVVIHIFRGFGRVTYFVSTLEQPPFYPPFICLTHDLCQKLPHLIHQIDRRWSLILACRGSSSSSSEGYDFLRQHSTRHENYGVK